MTAANAPSVNDAGAAMVVMSAQRAKELGLTPIARIAGFGQRRLASPPHDISPPDAPSASVPSRVLVLVPCSRASCSLDLDLAFVNTAGPPALPLHLDAISRRPTRSSVCLVLWCRGCVAGDAEQNPVEFTTAPSLAVPKALAAAKMELSDVQFHEINEVCRRFHVTQTCDAFLASESFHPYHAMPHHALVTRRCPCCPSKFFHPVPMRSWSVVARATMTAEWCGDG